MPGRAQRAQRAGRRSRSADELEIPFDAIAQALAGFARRAAALHGAAARRGGVTVVDDYGHHPAEIRATLAGRQGRRSTAASSRCSSRTATRARRPAGRSSLTAFNDADVLFVTDIYAAGEAPIPGVTARDLAEGIRAHGHRDVTYHGRRSRAHRPTTCARSAGRAIWC